MKPYLPPDNILRALTVKEPYASLLVGGVKLAENRTWAYPSTLPLPMTVAITSSLTNPTIGDDIDFCWSHDVDGQIDAAFDNDKCQPGYPGECFFYGGVIVGLVDIFACHCVADMELDEIVEMYRPALGDDADKYAAWSIGPYCYLIANQRRFRRGISVTGKVNFWPLTPQLQQQCIEHCSDLIAFPELPGLPIGGRPMMQLKRAARV